ncbi:MAG: hypothetical protein ABIQ77_00205 [Anaerolineales bacterium]
MKKIFSALMALTVITSLFTTKAFAAPTAMLTPTLASLGQLKVCKAAGVGVTVGKLFTINVNNVAYSVPAGPGEGGYCVLAGQFPVNTQVTVQESIPAGYYVSHIEVKPDRSISRDLTLGKAVVEIGSGVTEVILTNRAIGAPTPIITATPRPSNTPTATPRCAPNCTPTPTSIPKGRLQICKQADGAGVSGYFDFNFADKSKTVPVGACSALLYVDAGTLTITEVARAGFSVSDIYTIPADRLISKNLNVRTVSVTIVQGNAASQTIVVFRNRAGSQTVTPTPTGTRATPTFTPTGTLTPPTPTPTGTLTTPTFTPSGTITPLTPTPTGTLATATFTPTITGTPPTSTATVTGTPPTPTFTPTGTITPPVCTPVVVTANFSQIAIGASVEGLGVVAPGLNIDAKGTAIKVLKDVQPQMYLAPNSGGINGGLTAAGGFSDADTRNASQAHLYTFTFAPGTTVSNFSLHMLDFGDLNASLATDHYVSMTAYDVNGAVVAMQELSYTTPPERNPLSSNIYGNLQLSGDAASALPGQPGNWTWNVFGDGIVRVVLQFGVGYDPNIAFDTLTFGTACPQACTPRVVAPNLGPLAAGQSIEGLGVIAPGLKIDAKGTALKILKDVPPEMYLAPNSGGINGGLAATGGFSDADTRNASQAHLYTFTFAPGTTVSNFSLHMLDFGDLNPSLSINHHVSMTAYDVNGAVVAMQELSYTTPPERNPTSSNIYGNLQLSGDAASALSSQPGNWVWNVSGTGIVRVVLQFGVGHDPNIALDLLFFTTECPAVP